MAHRALVAYELDDESYYVVFSRWGAIRLEEADFHPSSPFAGGYVRPGRAVLDKALTEYYSKAADGRIISDPPSFDRFDEDDVEDEPRDHFDSLSTVVNERLNFLQHEAFLVVDADWNATRYRTIWTNVWPECVPDGDRYDASETIGEGVLYHTPTPERTEDDPDASVLREKRQEYEARVENGELPIEETQERFRQWVLDWAALDPNRIPPFSPYRSSHDRQCAESSRERDT